MPGAIDATSAENPSARTRTGIVKFSNVQSTEPQDIPLLPAEGHRMTAHVFRVSARNLTMPDDRRGVRVVYR